MSTHFLIVTGTRNTPPSSPPSSHWHLTLYSLTLDRTVQEVLRTSSVGTRRGPAGLTLLCHLSLGQQTPPSSPLSAGVTTRQYASFYPVTLLGFQVSTISGGSMSRSVLDNRCLGIYREQLAVPQLMVLLRLMSVLYAPLYQVTLVKFRNSDRVMAGDSTEEREEGDKWHSREERVTSPDTSQEWGVHHHITTSPPHQQLYKLLSPESRLAKYCSKQGPGPVWAWK